MDNEKRKYEEWDSVKEMYPEIEYSDFIRFQGLIDNPYVYEMVYSVYNNRKSFSKEVVEGELEDFTSSVFRLEGIIRNNLSSRIQFRNKSLTKKLGELNNLLTNMENRQLFKKFLKDTGKETEDIYDEIKKYSISGKKIFRKIRKPISFELKHNEKIYDNLVKFAIFSTDNIFNIYYDKYSGNDKVYKEMEEIKILNKIKDMYSSGKINSSLAKNIVDNYSKIKDAYVEIRYSNEVIDLLEKVDSMLKEERLSYDNVLKYINNLIDRYRRISLNNKAFISGFKIDEIVNQNKLRNVNTHTKVYKEYLKYRVSLENKDDYLSFSDFIKKYYNLDINEKSTTNKEVKSVKKTR